MGDDCPKNRFREPEFECTQFSAIFWETNNDFGALGARMGHNQVKKNVGI
jgi:hypothetical protein